MTIAEIYPGIEEEAVRVGADVYELYGVVDAVAHEYEFGGGDHMASSRTPLDWFHSLAGIYSFRAFAGGKATWILNYSWDGERRVDAREAMLNLFAAELTAGANVWDARGHHMSGSNDPPTRERAYRWIEEHSEHLLPPAGAHTARRRVFLALHPERLSRRLRPLVPGRLRAPAPEAMWSSRW